MTRMAWLPSLLVLRFPLVGGCAAPLVKSRTSAGICRNLNRTLCFHDAHRFSEIGFVRRILPISLVPLTSSACFCTPSGPLEGTSTRASWGARVDSGLCGGSAQSGDLRSGSGRGQETRAQHRQTTSCRPIRSLIEDGEPAISNRRARGGDLALPQENRARSLSILLILPISIMR